MFKSYRISIPLVLYCCLMLTASCSETNNREPVLPGICQMEEYLPSLQHRKVGIVLSSTSRIGEVGLTDTLLKRGINVVKLFSAEHGFKGNADAGAWVDDGTYANTRIPLISLYGKNRKPSPAYMQGIDIMVFDLQDVGVRFYTYISTLHYVMEACAEAGIPLVVLDRPNPNGYFMDGPLLDSGLHSFVGMHPVPVVYGMTIGEYALMINGEYWLADSMQCDLSVVPLLHYDHNTLYQLPENPSPNLQSMRAIYLYPSVCFFEGTIATEGRGTEAPFLFLGHPDYPEHEVAFTPHAIAGASLNPKFKDRLCYGVDLRQLPLDTILSWKNLHLEILIDFYHKMNRREDFFTDYFDLLAGTPSLRQQIVQGMSAQTIRNSWNDDLTAFNKIRVKYLLYPDFQ